MVAAVREWGRRRGGAVVSYCGDVAARLAGYARRRAERAVRDGSVAEALRHARTAVARGDEAVAAGWAAAAAFQADWDAGNGGLAVRDGLAAWRAGSEAVRAAGAVGAAVGAWEEALLCRLEAGWVAGDGWVAADAEVVRCFAAVAEVERVAVRAGVEARRCGRRVGAGWGAAALAGCEAVRAMVAVSEAVRFAGGQA